MRGKLECDFQTALFLKKQTAQPKLEMQFILYTIYALSRVAGNVWVLVYFYPVTQVSGFLNRISWSNATTAVDVSEVAYNLKCFVKALLRSCQTLQEVDTQIVIVKTAEISLLM